jgi:hypothetical protein
MRQDGPAGPKGKGKVSASRAPAESPMHLSTKVWGLHRGQKPAQQSQMSLPQPFIAYETWTAGCDFEAIQETTEEPRARTSH